MVKCKYCGLSNEDGAKICERCGKSISHGGKAIQDSPLETGSVEETVKVFAALGEDRKEYEEADESYRFRATIKKMAMDIFAIKICIFLFLGMAILGFILWIFGFYHLQNAADILIGA